MRTTQIEVMASEHLIDKHMISTLMLYKLSGLKTRTVAAGLYIRMVRTDHRAMVFTEDNEFFHITLAGSRTFVFLSRCAGSDAYKHAYADDYVSRHCHVVLTPVNMFFKLTSFNYFELLF
jgi:hypothetical protein